MIYECVAALLGRNCASQGFLKLIGVVKSNLNSFVGVYKIDIVFSGV